MSSPDSFPWPLSSTLDAQFLGLFPRAHREAIVFCVGLGLPLGKVLSIYLDFGRDPAELVSRGADIVAEGGVAASAPVSEPRPVSKTPPPRACGRPVDRLGSDSGVMKCCPTCTDHTRICNSRNRAQNGPLEPSPEPGMSDRRAAHGAAAAEPPPPMDTGYLILRTPVPYERFRGIHHLSREALKDRLGLNPWSDGKAGWHIRLYRGWPDAVQLWRSQRLMGDPPTHPAGDAPTPTP